MCSATLAAGCEFRALEQNAVKNAKTHYARILSRHAWCVSPAIKRVLKSRCLASRANSVPARRTLNPQPYSQNSRP